MNLISVIICTYNREDILPDTLSTLKQSILYSGQKVEVLIVNNNSTDHTDEIITDFVEHNREIKLILLHQSKPGLSYARNMGLANAKGDLICFLDDDVIVPEEWLLKIIKTAEMTKDTAVAGQIKLQFPNIKIPKWIDERYYGFYSQYYQGENSKMLPKGKGFFGANFAIPKKVYDAIGGFDESLGRQKNNLLSGEDKEYSKRIWDNGFSITYSFEGFVYHRVHPNRLTFKWLWRRYFWEGVSTYYRPKNHYPLYPLRRIPKLIGGIFWLILAVLLFNKKQIVKCVFRIANALGPFYGWYFDFKK